MNVHSYERENNLDYLHIRDSVGGLVESLVLFCKHITKCSSLLITSEWL